MKTRTCQEFLSQRVEYPNRETIERIGAENALDLFRLAARDVPAYRHFLQSHGVDSTKIDRAALLSTVPVTNKKNYIEQYPLSERCWGGDVAVSHAIAASSGSTGTPLFWPRCIDQEFDGALIHERIFRDVFDVHMVKSTLFVNAFALGNWIAGMYTQHCVHLLQLRGLRICLASPGFSEDETLNVLRNFAPQFEQTIVAGHPPVLRMLLHAAKDRQWPIQQWNLRFLGAGEGVSESFRDSVLGLAGAVDPLRSFINIYGSADAGLMGFETPLSIACTRLLEQRPCLGQDLLSCSRPACVYQFDPRVKYLEVQKDSIVVSADAAMPLLRYDILDQGELLNWDAISAMGGTQLSSIMSAHRVSSAQWELPLVAIYGRRDIAVSLYAINLYPENFKRALEEQSLSTELTGRFAARKELLENHRDQLVLDVELRPGVVASGQLAQRIAAIVVSALKAVNGEYRRAYENLGVLLNPVVVLKPYQDPILFPPGKTKKLS